MKTTLMCIVVVFLVSTKAFAKKGLFGTDERVHKIEDLTLRGAQGEELYLGYRTTSLFIFFGAYLKDEGYVLGVKGSYGTYYPLEETQIKSLQEKGSLPSPLPPYKIDLFDYLFGYSLWIMIVILGGLQLLKYRYRTKERPKKAV